MSPDDIASEIEDAARAEAIERERVVENPLPSIGCCYACRKPHDDGRRFCDAECRDDYEFFKAARERNGGVL